MNADTSNVKPLLAAAICLLSLLFLSPLALEGCSGDQEKADQDPLEARRSRMVTRDIAARGVQDPNVLRAMKTVPRHLFVPEAHRSMAYNDHPLPIGRGQTISQPYIVAVMTELAQIQPGESVLEIGTGSGYQAAVLAEITYKVYTIEIDCELAASARKCLDACGYTGVVGKCGDGYEGWPEYAPFDAIIVTAAAPRIPEPLKQQLSEGGVLVIPVGRPYSTQVLKTITHRGKRFIERDIEWVSFVPMTGKVEKEPQDRPK